jgi:hypothetical protein
VERNRGGERNRAGETTRGRGVGREGNSSWGLGVVGGDEQPCRTNRTGGGESRMSRTGGGESRTSRTGESGTGTSRGGAGEEQVKVLCLVLVISDNA